MHNLADDIFLKIKPADTLLRAPAGLTMPKLIKMMIFYFPIVFILPYQQRRALHYRHNS